MPIPMTASQVLDREFLEIRAKILQIAASLDRLERADGDVSADARLARIRLATEVLLEAGCDHTREIQQLFSLEYDADWRKNMGVPATAQSRTNGSPR